MPNLLTEVTLFSDYRIMVAKRPFYMFYDEIHTLCFILFGEWRRRNFAFEILEWSPCKVARAIEPRGGRCERFRTEIPGVIVRAQLLRSFRTRVHFSLFLMLFFFSTYFFSTLSLSLSLIRSILSVLHVLSSIRIQITMVYLLKLRIH